MTELRTRELDLLLPDGRALHVYEAGDPSGQPVLVHHGTPCLLYTSPSPRD